MFGWLRSKKPEPQERKEKLSQSDEAERVMDQIENRLAEIEVKTESSRLKKESPPATRVFRNGHLKKTRQAFQALAQDRLTSESGESFADESGHWPAQVRPT